MESYILDYRRRWRSVTQRILLLDVHVSESSLRCDILGSSNNQYGLCITLKDGKIISECTCLDWQVRKRTCKHLYWFGAKELFRPDPCAWTEKDIVEYMDAFDSKKQQPHGRNEDCAICLERVNYEEENTVCCQHGCMNSVHMICWNRYCSFTGSSKCVFCRNENMPKFVWY